MLVSSPGNAHTCPVCSALVLDAAKDAHAKWHKEQKANRVRIVNN